LPGQIKTDELLWSPANTGPLGVKNQVLTLHDLSPIEHPEWYARSFGMGYRFFVPLLVRRVRHVVVSSEYMRLKVMRKFSLPSENVTVVPGGVDQNRFRSGVTPPGGLPAHYILFVGSVQPRKNLGSLLQAWKTIQSQYPDLWLLMAGTTDDIFRKQGFTATIERVRWLGYVPEADLAGLYGGADVFVFPSYEEGFGLPLLEAMACGTPIIAAGAGALPEVAGDAVLWFDPSKPSELAETLAKCLGDAVLQHALAEKGQVRAESFTWERSTEKLWEVLQQCQ
jgi:glycosyltransferase involved in cell wall biosynthesis